ncbi:hypothetical protein EV401DRAFT_2024951 [Pisolithus croceorrhizus]|nr:hypothetical protein EV401DRAFT_2024951 [Pisolithus croceorrhizus]
MSSSVSYTEHSTIDGSLFVPEMLEYNARHKNKELCSISNLEFYRASQRVAHAVRPGRQSQDKEVAGIVANVDSVLYHALFLGIANASLIVHRMFPGRLILHGKLGDIFVAVTDVT